jgi:hypothetical protein
MMMELVGLSLAKALLQTESVQLVAIQVDFQSSGRDVVEVTATEINHGSVHGDGDDHGDDDVITACQLAVRIVAKKTGRIVSTGNLRFVKSSCSSSTTNTPRADNNNHHDNNNNHDIARDGNGGPILSRM